MKGTKKNRKIFRRENLKNTKTLQNATGKRSAGKPHAAFDEAGAGNGRFYAPRQFSTLPVGGVKAIPLVRSVFTIIERVPRRRLEELVV
jgi:hypothetical protein